MEAAAILVHGASLPTDRALWPSYTSGGKLAEPRLSEDGTIRKDHRRHSPALTISSTAARDEPPTEMSDGEELEEVSEEELEDDVGGEQLQEEEVEAEAEDETDESNLPVPIPPSAATPNQTGPRARSHSLAAPLQSHMPNVYGVGYAWSLIGENGQHGYATRSPTEYVILRLVCRWDVSDDRIGSFVALFQIGRMHPSPNPHEVQWRSPPATLPNFVPL